MSAIWTALERMCFNYSCVPSQAPYSRLKGLAKGLSSDSAKASPLAPCDVIPPSDPAVN
jgi:hypothetical protein